MQVNRYFQIYSRGFHAISAFEKLLKWPGQNDLPVLRNVLYHSKEKILLWWDM